MGVYGRHVFPRLMDWSLRGSQHADYRREALANASGHVLEIGFGTGLNLPHFPGTVEAVTAIDREVMLERKVARRLDRAAMPVRRLQLDASAGLPFETSQFDTVVSTWTLCSIAALGSALAEMRRVLKPDGRLLFLEHGRSDRPVVAKLQNLLNPLQNRVGRGCNLNRPIDTLIEEAGFELLTLDRFRMPNAPRVLGEIYRGQARPAGS